MSLLMMAQYPKYKAPVEEQEGIPRSWNPKEGEHWMFSAVIDVVQLTHFISDT